MDTDKEDEHEYILKIIQDQISKVQDKLSKISQKVVGLDVRCCERHKTSLDAQLQKLQAKETFEEERQKNLQAKVRELEKIINDHKLEAEQRFNGVQEAMKDRCRLVQEDNNQFRTRITTLEQQRSAREEQKITIKTQVIIGVIVAILTSLILNLFSLFSNFHISFDNGNKDNTQSVQTVEVIEQGNNK